MWFREDLPTYDAFQCDEWTEQQKVVEPSDGSGSSRVVYVDKSCIDIDKEQLDPRVITLQHLIEAGEVIQPGDFSSLLDLTDKAEIERFNTQYSQDAYKYFVEHEKEIFKSE